MSQSGRRELSRDERPPRSTTSEGRLVIIGNFDGVHVGHQVVLTRAGQEAARRRLTPTVLTFDPHPTLVLTGKNRPCLTTLPRKTRLLQAVVPGLDVWVEPFSLELAQLTPEEFAARILVQELSAQVVVVGKNFRFGRGRSGDLLTLQKLGILLGFEARAEELVGDEQGSYSSTRIRQLIAQGEVEEAIRLLGRPHLFSGRVAQGDRRGRALGFPTANLVDIPEVLPAPGVYAAHVYDSSAGGAFLGAGVAHLGARPTVDRPESNEVHVLGQELELYDKVLGVGLLRRLRGTKHFPSLQALKEQIHRDAAEAAQVASHLPPSERPLGGPP